MAASSTRPVRNGIDVPTTPGGPRKLPHDRTYRTRRSGDDNGLPGLQLANGGQPVIGGWPRQLEYTEYRCTCGAQPSTRGIRCWVERQQDRLQTYVRLRRVLVTPESRAERLFTPKAATCAPAPNGHRPARGRACPRTLALCDAYL